MCQKKNCAPPPPLLLGEGGRGKGEGGRGLNLLPNFQKRGSDRTSTLRGDNFFQGGREGEVEGTIFTKVYKQKYFSLS